MAGELRDENGRPLDFLLPQDTKKEVRLNPSTEPQTFVGLSFVHGHNDMRLDIQSLINLHPFFQEEQLLGWLCDEGDLFAQSIESGAVAEVMGRIDRRNVSFTGRPRAFCRRFKRRAWSKIKLRFEFPDTRQRLLLIGDQ